LKKVFTKFSISKNIVSKNENLIFKPAWQRLCLRQRLFDAKCAKFIFNILKESNDVQKQNTLFEENQKSESFEQQPKKLMNFSRNSEWSGPKT